MTSDPFCVKGRVVSASPPLTHPLIIKGTCATCVGPLAGLVATSILPVGIAQGRSFNGRFPSMKTPLHEVLGVPSDREMLKRWGQLAVTCRGTSLSLMFCQFYAKNPGGGGKPCRTHIPARRRRRRSASSAVTSLPGAAAAARSACATKISATSTTLRAARWKTPPRARPA